MTLGEWEPSVRGVALAVVVFVSTAAAVAPVAAGSATVGSAAGEPTTAESAPGYVQAAPPNESADGGANGTGDATANATTGGGANRTTVYHRNPEEVGGGVSEAEVWLASEMANRLSRSVDLSQSQRQRARQIVSNSSEYAELAQEYAAATDGSDEQVATFSDIGVAQRDLLATVGTYRTVHDRYSEVRQGDNRTRELRLAHELGRLARDVNRSTADLLEMYANLSANSSVNLRNTPDQIRNLRANVTRTQQQVRERSLVETRLRVDAVEPNGSFADPLAFEGRLTTGGGEPLADRNVTIEVGNESVEATTDRRGRFALDYRPVEARAETGVRTIRYRPANASRYASSSQRVRLDVNQVEPNVTISDRPDGVGYGERFVVEGRVGKNGVGAAVPLNVSVGDVKLNTTESADDGSFRGVAELPSNVTAGDRPLRVGVNLTGRALAGTATSVPVTVERTATDLSITAARQRENTVLVAGRLTTDDGAALENQTVELRVGGATAEATTNATGGYSTSVTIPPQVQGESSVEVRAVYEDDESNLRAARTDATVEVETASSSLPVRETLLRLAGVLGASVVGALLVRRYKPDQWPSFGDDADAESGTDPDAPDDRGVADAADPEAEAAFDAALDSARDERDAGAHDAAVVAAYEAVRASLGESLGDRSASNRSAATHWEFYADCRAAGMGDDRLDRLEELTARYEQAAFAAESVPGETADEAVELASSFRPEAADGEGGETGPTDDSEVTGGSGTDATQGAETDATAEPTD